MGATAIGRSIMLGLPAISLLFIAWQPAGLQLYFAASGLFSLGQAYLFNTPTTRKLLGIAPIYKPTGEKQDSLRMIQQEFLSQMQKKMNEQRSEVSGASTKSGNISMVDKMINNAKKEFSTMKKEMSEKVNNYTQSDAKNHDGSPAAPPRLSAAEKQSAESYKAQREIEDAHELAERNRRRVQEYEAFIAQQQANAGQAWRQKGKETATSKKPVKKSKARK